ncbi:MAG: hypothetical protein J6M02_07430 [Clostridia bacterium]|nr:hypothetical protein [Clostridia bacterium]
MRKVKTIRITEGKIVAAKVLEDGSCELVIEVKKGKQTEVVKKKDLLDDFGLIKASELTMADVFMQYKPRSDRQREFKELLTEAIQHGLEDFYHPKCDPALIRGKLCFNGNSSETHPAVGHSYNWWKKKSAELTTKYHCRLGTRFEYAAFLGVIIKSLIDNGWAVEEAWHVVCDDSRKIGNYENSPLPSELLDLIGTRRGVCGFLDLANTYKILAGDTDDGSFWLASGSYEDLGEASPLADMYCCKDRNPCSDRSVGWIVLEKS